MPERDYAYGVTVLNTSSFHVYTNVLALKCLLLKFSFCQWIKKDCCACFIFFLGKLGSVIQLLAKKIYNEKLFYALFLTHMESSQICIGNKYPPADGQLLCATVNFQNATQYIVFI